MADKIEALREDYRKGTLELEDTFAEPHLQFKKWFEEALQSEIPEPNAMVLATVDAQAKPAARVVLLKGFDKDGFVFYTNYDSQKGKELLANPHAALVFNWLYLQRQIRITGLVEKTSREDAQSYFHSRPRSSQIGAWVSPQSQKIESRQDLENLEKSFTEKFQNLENIPCPPHWGGYVLRPSQMEFWQGRTSRLHDRILYTLENNTWTRSRLAP